MQKRGAKIIEARGKSSAASAAQALIDEVRSWLVLEDNDWFSSAIFSNKNSYGIKNDLIFSFPCRKTPNRTIEVVEGLNWDPYIAQKIESTEKELIAERDMVSHLLT